MNWLGRLSENNFIEYHFGIFFFFSICKRALTRSISLHLAHNVDVNFHHFNPCLIDYRNKITCANSLQKYNVDLEELQPLTIDERLTESNWTDWCSQHCGRTNEIEIERKWKTNVVYLFFCCHNGHRTARHTCKLFFFFIFSFRSKHKQTTTEKKKMTKSFVEFGCAKWKYGF